MKLLTAPFVAAVVQAAPVFMDREATLDKACELILEAGQHGARLIVFPESFIPCYPVWVWAVPAERHDLLNELYTEFLDNAVAVPGDALDKLCRAARRAKAHVVVGVGEHDTRAGGAGLYNTLVYIDAQGQILGKHRQLVSAGGECLWWAQGDGSTLDVYNTPLGRLGGLINRENYMPLARCALYAWGVQIYVAATGATSEPWLATLRHIATEGGVFVLSASSVLRNQDIPDRYTFKQEFCFDGQEGIRVGNSAIVNPDGNFIAGPGSCQEEILYAEIDSRHLRGPRRSLDIAGHSARPDVFRLFVDRETRSVVTEACSAQAEVLFGVTKNPARGM